MQTLVGSFQLSERQAQASAAPVLVHKRPQPVAVNGQTDDNGNGRSTPVVPDKLIPLDETDDEVLNEF